MTDDYRFPSHRESWQQGNNLAAGTERRWPEYPGRYPPGRWWKQRQTLKLLLYFLLGAGVGVGHHFYYSYLDGRQAQNQSWIVRSGTAIAFLAKLLFSVSIGVAFPQRVWQTLRSRSLSIGAVDALFSLPSQASSFLNGEVLIHAKLASLIAAASWSLALVPILVSGSISVETHTRVQTMAGMSIQSLNFSKPPTEVQYNKTTPSFILPLAYTLGTGADPDQYVKPSAPASSFISNTLYGKRITDAPSPCGTNCSFSQTFVGPAYKCEDVDFTRNDTPGNPFCVKSYNGHGECGGSFDPIMSQNAFVANWYMARNSSGDLCDGIPDSCTAEPWWDGKLWFLYQYLLPKYRGTNTGTNSTPVPDDAWERHVFVCQSYNATYSLNRTYRNLQQTVEGTLSYLNPINFTGIQRSSSSSNTDAYPAWVIHQTLYSLLSGNIMPNGRMVETDTTGLAMSALVEDIPFPPQSPSPFRSVMAQKPVRFLREAIEDLHANITVGLLSLTPQLLYSQAAEADVVIENVENVWSYDMRVLLATYGLAALFDLIAVILGVRAMIDNGGCSGLGFARTVATSRANPALDNVVAGWDHGMDAVPKSVEKTNIMFGEARGARRAGFMVFNNQHHGGE